MLNIKSIMTGTTAAALVLVAGVALAGPLETAKPGYGMANGTAGSGTVPFDENTAVDFDDGFDERVIDDRLMVFFEPGSARLTRMARETLKMYAAHIKASDYNKLVVKGYEPETGPAPANPAGNDLTHRRTSAVVKGLVAAGVRIDSKPLSVLVEASAPATASRDLEEYPMAANMGNNRVDVIVEREPLPFPVSLLDSHNN